MLPDILVIRTAIRTIPIAAIRTERTVPIGAGRHAGSDKERA
jgi:hypothetical protein